MSVWASWLIKKKILISANLSLTTTIKKLWSCSRQTCSRCLIVFLSQLFVILIIFGCFWRIHLSKTCDETSVRVRIWCSRAGYILKSPRLYTSLLLQKIASCRSVYITSLVGSSETGKSELINDWLKIGTFQPEFDKFYFFINTPTHFTLLCKRDWRRRVR